MIIIKTASTPLVKNLRIYIFSKRAYNGQTFLVQYNYTIFLYLSTNIFLLYLQKIKKGYSAK